jgi:D-alanine--D-alanine ligase
MLKLRIFQPTHRDLKVGVLMGGTSTEREVSFKSGAAIATALEQVGFNVVRVELNADELPAATRQCQVVFPALHGGFGENGGIQQLLEDARLPYVGSDPATSRTIMDKEATKVVLRRAKLPVARGGVVTSVSAALPAGLSLPVIVKPNCGGSSVGLTLVQALDQWPDALRKVFQHEPGALVEEYLTGPELTVGLVDGEPLPPVEIVPPAKIYDYDAKYTYAQGKTEYFCPPKSLTPAQSDELMELGRRAYRALSVRDLVRVDLMLDTPGGKPRILEANSIPGFTGTSLLPKSAKQAGISFEQLCTHLVLTALVRGAKRA